MKLKAVCLSLKRDSPKSLALGHYTDHEHMELFLSLLEESKLERLSIRTDFWLNLEEPTILKFMETLTKLPALRELELFSSSRLAHMETFPSSHALLKLRQMAHLKRLNLEDFQITASHQSFLTCLAKGLEHHSSLQTVILTNFFANDHTNNSVNILDQLFSSLASIPNLSHLEVTGCGSTALLGQTRSLLSPDNVAGILSTLTCLETLTLDFLHFDDSHFSALSEPLERHPNLQTLRLNYHRMSSAGLKSILRSLQINTSVQELSLRSMSEIGDEGFGVAKGMLQDYNYHLKSLSLTATPSQQAELDLYLRLNQVGRGLLRNPSVKPNQWIEVLEACSEDVDVTRHLLCEVPELFRVTKEPR